MKRNAKLTIRTTEEDIVLLQAVCREYNTTVSNLLRSYIDSLIGPLKTRVIKGMVKERDGPEEPSSPDESSNPQSST